MAKKSVRGKIVRKSAQEIPPTSAADLERLRVAMRDKIDTSELPERRQVQRLRRNADGSLPSREAFTNSQVDELLALVEEWKSKLYDKLKQLTPDQEAAFWKQAHQKGFRLDRSEGARAVKPARTDKTTGATQ